MTSKPHDIVIQAEQIARRDGFADTQGWAAAKAPWRDISQTASPGAVAVYPEDANPDQKTVLEALRLQGKMVPYDGYHRNDYVAGDALKDAVLSHYAETRKTADAMTRNLAHKELSYSEHRTFLEYAAAELNWQRGGTVAPDDFVLAHEHIAPEQQPLVDMLVKQGDAVKGSGYHSNDYIATGQLAQIAASMEANLTTARSFANRVGNRLQSGMRDL